jgi:hypothetical protein
MEVKIKMNLKATNWGVMNSSHLAKDRNKWQAAGNNLGLLHFA